MIYAMFTKTTNLAAPGTHLQQVHEKDFQENPDSLEILQEIFRLADKAELTWPLEMSVVKTPDTVDNLSSRLAFHLVSHRRETPRIQI